MNEVPMEHLSFSACSQVVRIDRLVRYLLIRIGADDTMVNMLRMGTMGLLLVMVLSAIGCKKEAVIGDRVPVVPVKGIVTVDGEPVESVAVTCVPVGGKSESLPASSALTDKEGKFEIGTFEGGDGAPPGEYKLIFKWGQLNLMNGRFEGDKLNGRYSDPEKSEFTVTVKEGDKEGVDLGIITLTTK